VRIIAATCVVVGLMVAGAAQAEPVDMNPGEWQITTTVKIEGMPAGSPMPSQLPPQVVERCLTQEDLVPKPEQQAQQQCKITEQEVIGDTVKWTMTCDAPEGGAKGSGTGTITYSRETLKGAFIMKTQVPGMGEMTMSSKIEGKRLGPCEEQ
jgi:hypothetical protein